MTGGYRELRQHMRRAPLPPWNERLPLAFWRGSTTSSKNIDLNSLELNRRYQLARMSREWPNRLDARINRVVQCRDAIALKQVEHRLQREGLLSATVNPWHAALHAWQIDIDGNVNSWGLLWKLLSGSCILRWKVQGGSGITDASTLGTCSARQCGSEQSGREAYVV